MRRVVGTGLASQRVLVGIELGRAHCRRRVTSLALSIARWVHNSAMATFSGAPLSCRTAEFLRSGWKSWPVDGEPSHPRRGLSAGTHTPQTRMVCSLLRTISYVGLPRHCVRAPLGPWHHQVPRVPLPDIGVTFIRETCIASCRDITPRSWLLRTHAPIPRGSPLLRPKPRARSLCRL